MKRGRQTGSSETRLLSFKAVTLMTGCADGIMVAGGCGADTGGVA